jgi:hypothetical protein
VVVCKDHSGWIKEFKMKESKFWHNVKAIIIANCRDLLVTEFGWPDCDIEDYEGYYNYLNPDGTPKLWD